ncbi:hypothetical protein [uncultured Ruminococcus sp.]|uniref:hypothetical protein n=1 Tax=uncultured Ruminococcus sp. TaxID=165186 RepID=UPI0026093D0F|nr:hypothetical protein [uncultured Ruminococcus sp.]
MYFKAKSEKREFHNWRDIAQMLTANGHKLYFYTQYNAEKHRNDIEIDFLISNNNSGIIRSLSERADKGYLSAL